MPVISLATKPTTQSATRSTRLSQPCIYFVPLNGALSPADYEAGLALDWLSADEVAKVGRYKRVSARNNALQVRLALRAVLSLHSNLTPQQWRFSYGAKGKPALTEDLLAQTGLHFNLSHSGQWLMIGLMIVPRIEPRIEAMAGEQAFAADNGVWFGVDIEHERSNTDIIPILNHYFTQDETHALLQLPDPLRRQRFFDLWVMKESYIKARGLGLALSLKSFTVDFSTTKPLSADLSLPNNKVKLLAMLQPIELQFTQALDASVADVTWQSVMGRLNDGYRFAVTLGLSPRVDADNITHKHNALTAISYYQLSMADLLCGY